MCVTDGAGGGVEGGEVTAPGTAPPMISIKLDEALTHSIGSDVKHDKNVPDSICAPSSESYQRASSVSTQNKQISTSSPPPPPPNTTPNTSHCSIFALHRNQGCVAVSGRQVYLKRKHLILYFVGGRGSSSFLASLVKHTTLILTLLPRRGWIIYRINKAMLFQSVGAKLPYRGSREGWRVYLAGMRGWTRIQKPWGGFTMAGCAVIPIWGGWGGSWRRLRLRRENASTPDSWAGSPRLLSCPIYPQRQWWL